MALGGETQGRGSSGGDHRGERAEPERGDEEAAPHALLRTRMLDKVVLELLLKQTATGRMQRAAHSSAPAAPSEAIETRVLIFDDCKKTTMIFFLQTIINFNDQNACHSRKVLQFWLYFVDVVMESNTLHISDDVQHDDDFNENFELRHAWFNFNDSQCNVYELSAFIWNLKKNNISYIL